MQTSWFKKAGLAAASALLLAGCFHAATGDTTTDAGTAADGTVEVEAEAVVE